MQRRELVIRPVILESENSERTRLVQAIFAQEISEYGAHLLEAQGDLAALLFAGVGDDGVVRGVNFKPRRLSRVSARRTELGGEQDYAERDGPEANHSRRAEALLGKCYHGRKERPRVSGLHTLRCPVPTLGVPSEASP